MVPEMPTLPFCPLWEGNPGASAQGSAFWERALGELFRHLLRDKDNPESISVAGGRPQPGAGCQRDAGVFASLETGLASPASRIGSRGLGEPGQGRQAPHDSTELPQTGWPPGCGRPGAGGKRRPWKVVGELDFWIRSPGCLGEPGQRVGTGGVFLRPRLERETLQ